MEEAIKVLKKFLEIGKKPEDVEVAKSMVQALEQSVKKN